MVTIGFARVAGERIKKYGVYLFNIVGDPVQDRQHCANTIKDAYKIAMYDMKAYPFSCACIYAVKKKKAY